MNNFDPSKTLSHKHAVVSLGLTNFNYVPRFAAHLPNDPKKNVRIGGHQSERGSLPARSPPAVQYAHVLLELQGIG